MFDTEKSAVVQFRDRVLVWLRQKHSEHAAAETQHTQTGNAREAARSAEHKSLYQEFIDLVHGMPIDSPPEAEAESKDKLTIPAKPNATLGADDEAATKKA